jgi:hypothetical protein
MSHTCCNAYGDCAQGDTCPCRTGTVLPHQRRHVERLQDRLSAIPCTLDARHGDIPQPTEPLDQAGPVDLASFALLLCATLSCVAMFGAAMRLAWHWHNLQPLDLARLAAALLAPFRS